MGSDITDLQLKMLKNTDAVIELETKMVEIYRTRDEANRVVGIRVATADGYKTIEARKGVILATGGFSSNVDMRQTQVPYLTADLPTTNIKAASTGEGIYLAQAIGANTTQMSNIQRYPWADPNTGVLDSYAVWPFTGPSYGVIYVDYNGNRYVNEGDRRDVCANAAVNSGFISTYALFTEPVVSAFVKPEELEAGVQSGRVLKGETLEELAEKINAFAIKGQYPSVTAENLKATIEKHNGYIDSGADPDFGKVMAATMVKMEEGPYYAIPQYPSVHHTMGGLVIDTNTSVKDIYGQVIPGLFAAGSSACAIFAPPLPKRDKLWYNEGIPKQQGGVTHANGQQQRNVQKGLRGRLCHRRFQRQQHGNHPGHHRGCEDGKRPPHFASERGRAQVCQARLSHEDDRGRHRGHGSAHRGASGSWPRLRNLQELHRRRLHQRDDRRQPPAL